MRPAWNENPIPWALARRALRRWYESRRLEEIAAALPFDQVASGRVAAFLSRLVGRPLRVEGKGMGYVAVSNRAELLLSADLRTADRETDLRRLSPDSALLRSDTREVLQGELREDGLLSERAELIDRFLGTCRSLGDQTYQGTSLVDLLLMTRPPSQFDIACRWAQARQPMADLASVTNAVRGNRYDDGIVRQPDPATIDVTTLDWFIRGGPADVEVVLGNLTTKDDWWKAAALGAPVLDRARLAGIGRIVNEAIRARHHKKRPTLLVLPELSLPRHLFRPLANRLVREDVSLVTGLEYLATSAGVVNEAVGVFALGFKAAVVWWWPKSLPARGEFQLLAKESIAFVEHTGVPVVVSTDFGTVSTLICSELLDVKRRSDLLGRIDMLIVPAWNQDTSTFDHTIQTTANDLHCYVAVANNAQFSDSRLQVPSDERYLRDAARLISRREDGSISVLVSADELRKFQLASLANPTLKLPGFKPLPPGYQFRRS